MTQQKNQGSGTLQAESGGEKIAVQYAFDEHQKYSTPRPGLPTMPTTTSWRGSVIPINGAHLPSGIYQLQLSGGRLIRVQNLNGEWHGIH